MQIDNPIDTFLRRYRSKLRTVCVYRAHLNVFFKFLERDPITYFDDKKHDFDNDVLKFFEFKVSKGQAPSTMKSAYVILKRFFERNGIILSKFTKEDVLYMCSGSTIVLSNILRREELKQVLSCGQIKEKAVFSFACTTGMRINEIFHLKLSDIKFEGKKGNEITIVNISGLKTKSKTSRVTFASAEATKFLKLWLSRHRLYYIENKKKFYKSFDPEDNNRVFPWSTNVTRKMWNKCLDRAGFNQKDTNSTKKIYIYHFHTTRKWWQSHINRSEMQPHMYNYMMGHKGDLDSRYEMYHEDQLVKAYREAMPYLGIFSKYDEDKLDRMETVISTLTKGRVKDKKQLEEQSKILEEQSRLIERQNKIVELTAKISKLRRQKEDYNIEAYRLDGEESSSGKEVNKLFSKAHELQIEISKLDVELNKLLEDK